MADRVLEPVTVDDTNKNNSRPANKVSPNLYYFDIALADSLIDLESRLDRLVIHLQT